MKQISMDEVKRTHSGHFFDRTTMRFFKSRLPETAYELADGRRLFVSSERNGSGPRHYSIRVQTPTGDILTLADYGQFRSRKAANQALKNYAQEVE